MSLRYYVYVLRSLKDGRRYIGSTGNLERRLSEHDRGLVKSTRHRRPLELVYHEVFDSKEEAQERERFFKSGKGREYLQQLGI